MSKVKRTRRKFNAEFKTTVVLEALKERQTLSELAAKHNIHPNQITAWKQEFLAKAANVFESEEKSSEKDLEAENEKLYQKIGYLQVQVDFLKKNVQ